MAIVTTDSRHYADIATALRDMGNSEATYTPAQMASAILAVADQKFQEGMQAGYRAESGSFTLEYDTNQIVLDIPVGAKMVEIIPLQTPSATASTSRMPLHYMLAVQPFQDNNQGYPNAGAMVQYHYNSRYYTSYYAFDVSNGFSMEMAAGLVLEANIPYQWTAHYW